MSDEGSTPAEPETLIRSSPGAETGRTPGAGDTEVGASAGFASATGKAGRSVTGRPRDRVLPIPRIGLGCAAVVAVIGFAAIAIASPGPDKVTGRADAAVPGSTGTDALSEHVHSGDLCHFLLPPPNASSAVLGKANGTTESIDAIAASYGGDSGVSSTLRRLGFKDACYRTYQDSTMDVYVTIELIRFSGSNGSATWLSGYEQEYDYFSDDYKRVSVSGVSGAEGWSYRKDDGEYTLVSAYRDGDTFFDVSVFAAEPVSAPDLAHVLMAEQARLANG